MESVDGVVAPMVTLQWWLHPTALRGIAPSGPLSCGKLQVASVEGELYLCMGIIMPMAAIWWMSQVTLWPMFMLGIGSQVRLADRFCFFGEKHVAGPLDLDKWRWALIPVHERRSADLPFGVMLIAGQQTTSRQRHLCTEGNCGWGWVTLAMVERRGNVGAIGRVNVGEDWVNLGSRIDWVEAIFLKICVDVDLFRMVLTLAR